MHIITLCAKLLFGKINIHARENTAKVEFMKVFPFVQKEQRKKLTQNKNSIRIGDDILTYDREECCKV